MGVVITDEWRRILQANGCFCRMLGYAPAELVGRRVDEITHPDDRDGSLQLLVRLLRREIPRFQRQKRYLRTDGSVLWARTSVSVSRRDSSGKPCHFLAMIEDITERKRAEDALRIREADVARAQAAAHLGSWRWDLVTDTVTWSEELFRIFGVDPATFLPSNDAANQLIHPEDRQLHRERVAVALTGKQIEPFELRLVRSSGEERVILASGFQAEFDAVGNPILLCGTVQDITERTLLQERRRPGYPTSPDRAGRGAFSALGTREREILQRLAEGRISKEIATQLKISVRTVDAHRRNIMLKLDLHSVADLTRYAIREGLVQLDE